MRVKTAATRRAIDKWKARAKAHVGKSQIWALEIITQLLTSTRRGRVLLLPLFGLALLVNFAALEFVALVFLGFFIAKLKVYAFVNAMLRFISFSY